MRPTYMLPALVLLLASCTDPEQEYQRRRQLATPQPPAALGFKLRVGTPRAQALQQLDSLRHCHALVARVRYFSSDSIAHLPMEPHPVFVAGKLVGLQLALPELAKWQWVGILDSLRGVYGMHYDRHPDTEDWQWYWFAAGTEIDFGLRKPPATGQWVITYGPVVPLVTTPPKKARRLGIVK